MKKKQNEFSAAIVPLLFEMKLLLAAPPINITNRAAVVVATMYKNHITKAEKDGEVVCRSL